MKDKIDKIANEKTGSPKLIKGSRSLLLFCSLGVVNLEHVRYIGPLYNSSDDIVPYAYVIEYIGFLPAFITEKDYYNLMEDIRKVKLVNIKETINGH